MQQKHHPIATEDNVARYQLASFHFGAPGQGRKAYIQASLHADEVPAMLVAHVLRRELERLDAAGKVKGEVILVPAANPIGLSQVLHGAPFGRFDLASGINFNRSYKHVADDLKVSLAGLLGPDPAANAALVRAHARRSVAAWLPKNATEELKKTLLGMAIDADVMLDLHCDNEAVLHLYTGTPLADDVQPLSALLQAHAVLLATASGGEPFDEACSRVWWELAAHFGPATPIPMGCIGVTVELRGENDVRHDLAEQDAHGLLQYLGRLGIVDVDLAPLPAPRCAPTPLEGVEPLHAPQSGVLVFSKHLGDRVEAGDVVAEIINPVSGRTAEVRAAQAGILFASTAHRHLLKGMHVCKIAGKAAYRTGNLLTA
ncbi:succinylglutamate desuccinylase/aspartoacylase family protein [uncultured Massilia sp.]|uniref:succinylglutamate desuccinylase/aspartoacylase family protein n=1 Tax=uncultured Massilia sp. TaxID=169973 RepID=UPI0025DF6F0A|nr:succinylglutamate desuccinylase/aspartoacylase family protein [uncultured Massilia sp.]